MKRFHKEILFSVAIHLATATILVLSIVRSVNALDYGPQQVIDAVNGIRAQYDLAPYNVSQALMEIAQQQAIYMAQIQQLTHDRPDGSGVPTTAENIAFGPVNLAIGSWIDDQLHFDTLTGWSSGQVGVGVAQGADGRVYISLNMNSYGDTVFKSIPYTLQPGVTPQPVPTQAPVIARESEDDTTENEQQDGEVDGQEGVTYVLPAVEIREDYAVASDKPVNLIMPDQHNEPIETKDNGETTAFILLGIGALALLTSVIGFMYSMRLRNTRQKANTEPDDIDVSTDEHNTDTTGRDDTNNVLEIPQDVPEE